MDNRRYKLYIIIISSLSSFLTPFMGSAINISLPYIAKDIDMNPLTMSWVATSYLLASAVFLLPFGKIADIYGKRKIFLYGIIIFTLFSCICGLSTSSIMLIISRVFQGMGAAMIYGISTAIITNVFPEGERGKMFGINAAAVYVGLASGPFVGGMLTHYIGWRSIFFINVPIGFLIIILVIFAMKEDWIDKVKQKFDFSGSVIYGAMLIAIIYGFSKITSIYGLIFLITGIILFPVFIWRQNNFSNPLLNVSLFQKNITFAFSNLAALLNYCGTFAINFILSLYLQYVKHFDASTAGMILLIQPLVMALFSPITGRLSDKIHPRTLSTIGMIITTISILQLVFIGTSSSIMFICIDLFILGTGFALFASPNINSVMGSVEKPYYGVASGTLSTMRITGQMISMGITMLVFSIFLGKAKISNSNIPDFIHSLKILFIIMTVVSFSGIFASYARGKNKQA